jgi:circadian clock protein KaiB
VAGKLDEPRDHVTETFERALAAPQDTQFVLCLYVAGSSQRSLAAVERVSRLCAEHLPGRYELQVIDIYQHPAMAEAGQVIAAPTLVRSLPQPLRRVVGDMADEGRVLLALGIRAPT